MPSVFKIRIYPFKSLDGQCVDSSRIVESGALQHDREYVLVDSQGRFVNAKRNVQIHKIASKFDFEHDCIYLGERDSGVKSCFGLTDDKPQIERWFSEYFDQEITIQQNSEGGFPDDIKSPGPTVISEATLCSVAEWYCSANQSEFADRFRANIEITGCDPFWEDQLFAKEDEVVQFRIGDVLFEGTNPCRRCIVPTRDSKTGEQTPDFANTFMKQRELTLPIDAERSRFDMFYRLSTNTKVPKSEVGKVIKLGDEIVIIG